MGKRHKEKENRQSQHKENIKVSLKLLQTNKANFLLTWE